jgi:hypothetical protein
MVPVIASNKFQPPVATVPIAKPLLRADIEN